MKQSATIAALLLALASCDRQEPTVAGSHDEPAEAPTNRVEIPATVRRNLGITFAKVERRIIQDALRVPGVFELKPRARREYRLVLPGQVRFEVDQFQAVDPGTTLFRVLSPGWADLKGQIHLAATGSEQAELKLAAIQARIGALADASFKNAELEAESLMLQAELIRHKAELGTALTTAANLLNSFRDPAAPDLIADDLLATVPDGGGTSPLYQTIHWLEVKAAAPGLVKSIDTTDGAFAEAGTLIVTTIDPTQLRFRALALQSDLTRFDNQPAARIVPPQAEGAAINNGLAATLTLGLEADPAQRTLTLFADPEMLLPWARPGVSAFLEVSPSSNASPVLAIPRSAVVKDGITHVFFKRDPMDPNKAIRVEADLGTDDGRWIEIKSDLGPNDEVVLDGAFELKLATSSSGTAQKGGHFHADGTFHEEH
jgi:multidrug efflux pump subunit AcrA (membrane-fusion protein)